LDELPAIREPEVRYRVKKAKSQKS
jgi:hypothetical protein